MTIQRQTVNEPGVSYDFIGDVHGCLSELRELLINMGYRNNYLDSFTPPAGRKLVFVGDLVDRGDDTIGTLGLYSAMSRRGYAYSVMGNHEHKLLRYLKGNRVSVRSGLETTVAELNILESSFNVLQHDSGVFKDNLMWLLESLPLCLDLGDTLVVHGAYSENVPKGKFEAHALYGVVAGKTPEGYPLRLENWKEEYEGDKNIIVGHTPLFDGDPLYFTTKAGKQIINIDTACTFGGWLTGLRMPEGEVFRVKAKREYWERCK